MADGASPDEAAFLKANSSSSPHCILGAQDLRRAHACLERWLQTGRSQAVVDVQQGTPPAAFLEDGSYSEQFFAGLAKAVRDQVRMQ